MPALMPPLAPPDTVNFPWIAENLRFGVGWQAFIGDIAVHVFKIRNPRPGKQCYQFRVERLDAKGRYKTVYNSMGDNFNPGSQDYRGAKAQAEIWFNRYAFKEGLR